MAEVSKSTLAVIMVLTLLISVVGTLTMLKLIAEPIAIPKSQAEPQASGKVSLSISREPEPQYSHVSLSIKNTGD